MVDLWSQHQRLEQEIQVAIGEIIRDSAFIQGKSVNLFEQNLAAYLGAGDVIGCANGTDALQIALMALGLNPGDEVIVPAFTYIATAEAIALLGLIPVMADVDESTFNLRPEGVAKVLTSRSRAIIPVHLFGQCSDMDPLMKLAGKHNLWVIEDNAQSLGADYIFPDGTQKKAGTIGHIGCTSFFPTKNLGCMGDGGALITNDPVLARKIRMIANHGQEKKYYHDLVGCNSRLDSLQAAILNVKLPHLDEYIQARRHAGAFYQDQLSDFAAGMLPVNLPAAKPTYNQFTIKILHGKRDPFRAFLSGMSIPTMVYYPLPLYRQKAYSKYVSPGFSLPACETLCDSVVSIPMHTEMKEQDLFYIRDSILAFKP